jgi:dihydrofolate reductase
MGEIIIIAAIAENRVIGRNNALPWSLKEDMAHFKELTVGWPCIMGRKTWDSLPQKPLPGRSNIIISKSITVESLQNVKIFPSLPAAVEYCAGFEKIFICGGEAIYRQAVPLADIIELTLIHRQYDGDAFFPEIDALRWTVSNTVHFDNFSFITYTKNQNNIIEEQI